MFATASAARTPFLSFEPRRELEPENRSHLKFRKFLRTARHAPVCMPGYPPAPRHVCMCTCALPIRGRRRVVYFKLRRVLSADYDLLSIYVERPPRHVCVAERRLLLTYRTYVGINTRQPNGSLSIAYRMCSGGQQWWKGVGGDDGGDPSRGD